MSLLTDMYMDQDNADKRTRQLYRVIRLTDAAVIFMRLNRAEELARNLAQGIRPQAEKAEVFETVCEAIAHRQKNFELELNVDDIRIAAARITNAWFAR